MAPWPRDLTAQVIEEGAKYGAKVNCFWILFFPEPQNFGLQSLDAVAQGILKNTYRKKRKS